MKNLKTPKGLRKGQTIFNFLAWLKTEKGFSGEAGENRMADPFYIDNKKFEDLYEEYLNFYEECLNFYEE